MSAISLLNENTSVMLTWLLLTSVLLLLSNFPELGNFSIEREYYIYDACRFVCGKSLGYL